MASAVPAMPGRWTGRRWVARSGRSDWCRQRYAQRHRRAPGRGSFTILGATAAIQALCGQCLGNLVAMILVNDAHYGVVMNLLVPPGEWDPRGRRPSRMSPRIAMRTRRRPRAGRMIEESDEMAASRSTAPSVDTTVARWES